MRKPAALAGSAVAVTLGAAAVAPPSGAPHSNPGIVQSRIPFPAKRKAEMRRYAIRHYGLRRYTLDHPKVIVEHFTGSDSYRAAYQTFARDAHQTHADFSHTTMNHYRRLLGGRAAAAATSSNHFLLGRSVQGRRIVAVERGDSTASRKVLVFGIIHGNETAGAGIVRKLERLPLAAGADLWLVERLNPDGVAAHRRQNAHGVDLNRNFPYRWRPLGRRGDLTWSGPRPSSEAETRIARSLIRRVRPAVTIWFHQPLALVDRSGGDVRIERAFARRVQLPIRQLASYPGSATSWQDHRYPGTTAFVVELPPGRLSPALRDRCASAIVALASARLAAR